MATTELTNIVNVSLRYNRSSQQAIVTTMDPDTHETAVTTINVAGHWEDPAPNADPELVAVWNARQDASRQKVATMKAEAQAETQEREAKLRIDAAKPVYGRV